MPKDVRARLIDERYGASGTERLAKEDKPFLLFLRHMDPHSPYLPPAPYEDSSIPATNMIG